MRTIRPNFPYPILSLQLVHLGHEMHHCVFNILLQIHQRLHSIDPTNQPSLRAMNPLIRLRKQVEFPMPLKNTIPVAFPEFRSSAYCQLA
jgi:hypothetical protein